MTRLPQRPEYDVVPVEVPADVQLTVVGVRPGMTTLEVEKFLGMPGFIADHSFYYGEAAQAFTMLTAEEQRRRGGRPVADECDTVVHFRDNTTQATVKGRLDLLCEWVEGRELWADHTILLSPGCSRETVAAVPSAPGLEFVFNGERLARVVMR